MKIIGIDFSYSSTGITVWESNADSYTHYAILNKATITRSKIKDVETVLTTTPLLSTLSSTGVILSMVDRTPISITPKYITPKGSTKKIPNPEYSWNSISTWHAIHYAQTLEWSTAILEVLSTIAPTSEDYIIIENYDFGKRGSTDNIIQMVEHTYATKSKIITTFPTTPFLLVSSTEVKAVAGNGNYNKKQMLTAFLSHTINTPTTLTTALTTMEEKLYNPKADTINSPVGDIVDSYWIVQYLKSKIL